MVNQFLKACCFLNEILFSIEHAEHDDIVSLPITVEWDSGLLFLCSSQCSVSCGLGVQKRQVLCEQKITAFTIATVPDAHCLAVAAEHGDGEAAKPATEQQCHLGDCPARPKSKSRRRRSAIVGEPTEFVLMSPRDLVTLEVGGGIATVIPAATVRIFCPVRRRFRGDRVVWRLSVINADNEDGDTIGKRGRVKVTGNGILRIRKSRPSDAGVYWCIVGVDRANLTLKLHSLDKALAMAHQRLQLAAAEGHHDVCQSSVCLTGSLISARRCPLKSANFSIASVPSAKKDNA